MRFLYIGYYVEDSVFNEIDNKKINDMSPARQKFEFNLLKGLKEMLGDMLDVVTYVPSASGISIPDYTMLHGISIKHIQIEKKSLLSMIKAKEQFSKLMSTYSSDELKDLCVLMYAVNPVFLGILSKYQKKYGVKLVTICSEVPKLRRGNDIKNRIKKVVLSYYNKLFDGYVLFSEKMCDVMDMTNKRSMVVEGIAPKLVGTPQIGKRNIVMYAGGLAEDNNIKLLINACESMVEVDELWICGIGPEEKYVKTAEAKNEKIKYFGRVPNTKVVELEQKAKLLVNLRNPNEELTKYSFPSKILEYISSGSMVLSTRLEGIPKEYFDYIEVVDHLLVSEVQDAVRRIMCMDDHLYVDRCKKSQIFISEKKNYKAQTEKIVKFCREL